MASAGDAKRKQFLDNPKEVLEISKEFLENPKELLEKRAVVKFLERV